LTFFAGHLFVAEDFFLHFSTIFAALLFRLKNVYFFFIDADSLFAGFFLTLELWLTGQFWDILTRFTLFLLSGYFFTTLSLALFLLGFSLLSRSLAL
jgi:hypothetical protein